MNWKSTLKTVLKAVVTIGIFFASFAEFGGGPVAVSRQGVLDGTIYYKGNPEMPGIVGKLKARLTGASLPEATVPLEGERICKAAAEGTVYVHT